MSAGVQLPLKWHGGKSYLAERIIAMMPRHLHYVEPYFGGGAVLLNRDPNDEQLWLPPHKGVSEVANDLNKELTNFWHVLANPSCFEKFQRIVQGIPLSRAEFEFSKDPYNFRYCGIPIVDEAVKFFVRCRQSRAGSFKGFTSLTRNRLRRGVNGNASEWLGAVEGLPQVHARLRPVVIENRSALEIIRSEDAHGTFFYCDPPYLHETRASKDAYAYEMSKGDHEYLLETLGRITGKFILSGYPSDLYDRYAKKYGWSRKEFELPNNAAGGKSKRRMTEVVWYNY